MISVSINGNSYTEIKVVSFEPVTDILGDELPINVIVVNIKTNSGIENGEVLELLVNGALLAKYYVSDVQKANDGFVRIEAKSVLMYLDRDVLPAAIYEDEPFANVVNEVFYKTEQKLGTVHNTSSSITEVISGYCPQQTARERLQWICFVAGAYVQTEYSSVANIKPIDSDSVSLIPDSLTFWKPTTTYKDYVTSVKLTYYEFTVGTPVATDEWVEVNGVYYIQTSDVDEGINSNVPQTARENVINISDITLVNPDNVYDIMARLESFYFSRVEISADVLNSMSFLPAQRVQVNNGSTIIDGFIKSSSYLFGNAIRTRLSIKQYADIDVVVFSIIFSGTGSISVPTIDLVRPAGYQLEYDVEYPDIYSTSEGRRYIFLPSTTHISEQIPNYDSSLTIPCSIAIVTDLYEQKDVMIYSVDSVTETGGVVTIG